MNIVLETAIHVIKEGGVRVSGQDLAIFNASYHKDLKHLSATHIMTQQVFKPYYDVLRANDINVVEIPEKIEGIFDVALVMLPKNMVEAQYVIAHALQSLRSEGVILCVAENRSGGTRLQKMLQKFRISDLSHESKNKCRAVWGRAISVDQNVVKDSIKQGRPQHIADQQFVSQPGIFGWNKIDKGSEILTRYIPKDIKSRGADFGCGYGYLARHALDKCDKIKHISCFDADYRSVQLCEQNLAAFNDRFTCEWIDLTQALKKMPLLDFVLMNPPFHEGKQQDIQIGRQFIQNAHGVLRRGGRLWMVANAHLPYEEILGDVFFSCIKHHEGQGFKVYEALK